MLKTIFQNCGSLNIFVTSEYGKQKKALCVFSIESEAIMEWVCQKLYRLRIAPYSSLEEELVAWLILMRSL